MSFPMTKLAEITEKIGSGVTPRGGDSVYVSEGTPLIRSQNVYNSQFDQGGLVFIDEKTAQKMKGVAVLKDDVLLNITGDSVARCCKADERFLPARVNQHVAIIRPKKDRLNPDFLMFYLTSPYMQTKMLSWAGSGGTRKALTKGMIEGFEVPTPDIEVQAEISEILKNYNDLIETNKRRIELLEESTRQLYKEWFVRFRFPGHEHVKIIDGVPEGWSKGVVSQFYRTSSGGTPSRKIPEFYTGNINWVKTQELNNCFIFDTEEKITEEAVSKSSAKLHPENSVLVAMYGATIGELGILAKPSTTNQACCALMTNSENAHYTHAYLFLKENKTALIGMSKGAAQNNISQDIIKNMDMLMPPRKLLEQFVDIVDPIFLQIKTLALQTTKLTAARDILLPKLMSGEVAV